MQTQLETIKPLVIGVGSSGQRHLDAQVGMGFITGAYDINPLVKQRLRDNTQVIVFENLFEAFKWANLVHICTPDDQHTEFAAEALKRRVVVLCEKPFTTKLQDALDLQRLTHELETPLFVGHNYRLTPSFLETRKRVLEGQLGTITYVKTTYLHDMTEYQKNTPWRADQDFLYGAGTHPVDLAMWVINERISTVQAITGRKIRPEYNMPESYSINLKFESGTLGYVRLDASLTQPFYGTDVKVDGSEGCLASHNKVNRLRYYRRGNKQPHQQRFENLKTFTIASEVKLIDNYLMGKSPTAWPLPEVDEAVNVMRVLDSINKAVNSGSVEKVIY